MPPPGAANSRIPAVSRSSSGAATDWTPEWAPARPACGFGPRGIARRRGLGWPRARGVASNRIAGPVSTIRPSCSTAIRSATRATAPRSWLMRTSAVPRSRMSRNVPSTCAAVAESRAVVGSSATMSAGSAASADAMSARWRIPPESSPERCASRASGSGRPAAVRASSTDRRRAAPRTPLTVRASPTSAPIVRSGSSDCSAS